MLTSAVAGEGKTTVAVDLSHTIALAGRNVVLVELDLRRPTFSEHFGLDAHDGLTTALTCRPARRGPAPAAARGCPQPLRSSPRGASPSTPQSCSVRRRSARSSRRWGRTGRWSIVDAPPLNPVADAHVLLNNPAIHAAILIARIGPHDPRRRRPRTSRSSTTTSSSRSESSSPASARRASTAMSPTAASSRRLTPRFPRRSRRRGARRRPRRRRAKRRAAPPASDSTNRAARWSPGG